jgi:hypothetical protein
MSRPSLIPSSSSIFRLSALCVRRFSSSHKRPAFSFRPWMYSR